MKLPVNTLEQLPVDGKRVFVRADLNVPLTVGSIASERRITSLFPTLDYLRSHNASIILCTHLGKPKTTSGDYTYDALLSTTVLAQWLIAHGYPTIVEHDLKKAAVLSYNLSDTILLLENIRFYAGETSHNASFAEQLTQLADIYVNDAFGALHRTDSSLTLLAQQFQPAYRGIGKLVEHELVQLNQLRTAPTQPFVLVMGGNKIHDKLSIIASFITKAPAQRPSKLIIGGKLGLACLGIIQDDAEAAQALMHQAKTLNLPVILPIDHIIKEAPAGLRKERDSNMIPPGCEALDIGPKTIALFTHELHGAQTIFINGCMGKYEEPSYERGTEALLRALTTSSAVTIVAGGDTTAAANHYGLDNQITLLSTGGGATLTFLASTDPFNEMPALAALTR